MMGQECDALHLLIGSQSLLQGFQALHDHFLYIGIIAEAFATVILHSMIIGPFFHEPEFRHDQCRDKLALVGHHSHLVDILVHQHHRLHHLRGDILAVAGLEKILDTLLEIELAVLHISSVARTEEAVGIKRLGIDRIAVIISGGDGRTLEKDLTVGTDLHFHLIERTTH